jgi:NQR2, RnfD, RnfE family
LLWALRRLAVAPETAPPWIIAGIALAAPVAAGIVFFRLVAVQMLVIALTAGVLGHVAAALLKQPVQGTLILPAVIGVALVGPGASLLWAAGVAVLAVGMDLARARYAPLARAEVGLAAYALILLVSRGGPAVYVGPGTSTPTVEPIRLWLEFYGGAQAPIDPVRLYVGNVAGPVFATSVLAVAVGAAWLWYSGRLSILVILTFLIGTMVPISLLHWSAAYQLDSGPLWFAAALVLADRRTLPTSQLGRPLLGFVAGLVAMGARARGFSVESGPVAVAAAQLLADGTNGTRWLIDNWRDVRTRLQSISFARAERRGLL